MNIAPSLPHSHTYLCSARFIVNVTHQHDNDRNLRAIYCYACYLWDFWHSLSWTILFKSGLYSVVANRSNSFTWVSVRTDRCFDFTIFRVENTDLQMYVDPNIASILSAARLTLGYFFIGTLFQDSMVASLKAGLSWSSSQRSIISNSAATSSETRGAFKQSVLELNGPTRNVICGLSSCRSRNRGTKLSCRVSRSVAYLTLCLFRAPLVTCPLAFSRVGKCFKSPFWICALNNFSLLIKASTLFTRSGSVFNLPCKFRFNLFKWVTQHVD